MKSHPEKTRNKILQVTKAYVKEKKKMEITILEQQNGEEKSRTVTFEGEWIDITMSRMDYCGKENCKQDFATIEMSIDMDIDKAIDLLKFLKHGEYDRSVVTLELFDAGLSKECSSCCNRGKDYEEVLTNVILCKECIEKLSKKTGDVSDKSS